MVQWFMAMLKSAGCCVRASVRYSTEVAQSPLTSGRQWHWTQCALSGSLVSTELSGDTPAIIVAVAVSRSHDSYRCHNCREDISRYRVV